MALIEGVGDEVTALFGLLAALAVLALAWFSTRTGEPPEDALLLLDRPAPTSAAEEEEEAAGGGGGGSAPRAERPPDGASVQAAAAPPSSSSSSSSGRREQAKGGERQEAEVAGDWPGPPSRAPAGLPPGAPSPPPPPPREPSIVLRLKFLNDTERLARVHPDDTVGALKRAYFPGQEQLVRLIYQGQLLRDDSQTLAALRLTHHSVVHCYVSQHRPATGPVGAQAAANVAATHTALNVGSLMVPLLVLMLGTLWYFQLQYRHIFTATATTCLAGLTLVVSFVAFAVYRR